MTKQLIRDLTINIHNYAGFVANTWIQFIRKFENARDLTDFKPFINDMIFLANKSNFNFENLEIYLNQIAFYNNLIHNHLNFLQEKYSHFPFVRDYLLPNFKDDAHKIINKYY